MGNQWRLAVRRLARTPLLTLAIVTSLTISIAAVTITFSIVDAVLVRALPFRNAANLVWLSSVRPQVAARELYESVGFRLIQLEQPSSRVDIAMALLLTPQVD